MQKSYGKALIFGDEETAKKIQQKHDETIFHNTYVDGYAFFYANTPITHDELKKKKLQDKDFRINLVIASDGKMYEALPSHDELSINKYLIEHNITKQDFLDMWKGKEQVDYDFRHWLWELTGDIFVFEKFVLGNATMPKQNVALKKLKILGLYTGRTNLHYFD